MAEPSVFERVVAEAISDADAKEWLTNRQVAMAVLHALATSDEVREALVERVNWRDHDHSPRPCCLAAILAVIRPEAT